MSVVLACRESSRLLFFVRPCCPLPLARLHSSGPSGPTRRFPTIPTCPRPTCACAPGPALPDSHPIDRTSRLGGAVSAYSLQILVCTGRDDWPSRIEDDQGGENDAARLKAIYGPRGTMFDLTCNVSVLNSSFPPSDAGPSAYLLPTFDYIPCFSYAAPPPPLTPGAAEPAGSVRTRSVMVLICGHAGRDLRCGIIGPLLRTEFEQKLAAAGIAVLRDPPASGGGRRDADLRDRGRGTARVGLVSHVGGHKFAGNVIIYFPPDHEAALSPGERHPLAGMGIWYGRVEPAHVEGIVQQTVLAGRVVEDIFRGGIDSNRKMIKI